MKSSGLTTAQRLSLPLTSMPLYDCTQAHDPLHCLPRSRHMLTCQPPLGFLERLNKKQPVHHRAYTLFLNDLSPLIALGMGWHGSCASLE